MEADTKRRQISADQLTTLLEFLKDHQELAKGLTRGRRGKLHSLKLWNLCAKKLNLYKNGAVKDGRGWSKYWCDWKYRVRRRALELKAAQDSNRPPPDGITTLSPMEEKIMSIIGEKSLERVVIKCDPLGEEGMFEKFNNEDHIDATSLHQYSAPETRHMKMRKRRLSSRQVSDLLDADSQVDPTTPPEQKPRIYARNTDDSDDDGPTAQFLQLEKQKLDTSKSIQDSLKTIASEITRLTDVMSHIKDVLIDRINI